MKKIDFQLRNASYQKNFFPTSSYADSIRKHRRLYGRMSYRNIETALSSDLDDENFFALVESLDFSVIPALKLISFIDRLSLSLSNQKYCDRCLEIFGDLAIKHDILCDKMASTEIIQVSIQKIKSNDYENLENAIWCLGNLAIGSKRCRIRCIELDMIESVLDYLNRDYEKSEDSVNNCLWSIWCLTAHEIISSSTSEMLLDNIIELLDYSEYQEETLKIIMSLVDSNPNSVLKILHLVISQNFSSNLSKILFLKIITSLSQIIVEKKDIINYVYNIIENNPQVNTFAYECLSCLTENVSLNSKIFDKALTQINTPNLNLLKNISRFLCKAGELNQSDITNLFSNQVLLNLQNALKNHDEETLNYLLRICEFLLEAGLKGNFIDSGCLDALSSTYFRSNTQTEQKISKFLHNYF
jgi:uncharacterized protein YuzB (UPF0349 family)